MKPTVYRYKMGSHEGSIPRGGRERAKVASLLTPPVHMGSDWRRAPAHRGKLKREYIKRQ